MSMPLYLLTCLLYIFMDNRSLIQENCQCKINHQGIIVIKYVPEHLDKHFYLMQPHLEYLKIPDFPDQLLCGVEGLVSLNVKTDGHKVVSISQIGIDPNYSPLLEEIVRKNVQSWRFRKHDPRVFTTSWKYILGEIIDDTEEIDEYLDDVYETDTATLESSRHVEIVMFPRGISKTDLIYKSNHTDSCCHGKTPQVEYLKIPESPFGHGFKQDVTMKVKTDGHKVVSVEAIGHGSPIYKNSFIDSVKTWRFKEHTPTEFITRWKWDVESSATQKPNTITLKLPYEVHIKTFYKGTPLEIIKRKVKKVKRN